MSQGASGSSSQKIELAVGEWYWLLRPHLDCGLQYNGIGQYEGEHYFRMHTFFMPGPKYASNFHVSHVTRKASDSQVSKICAECGVDPNREPTAYYASS